MKIYVAHSRNFDFQTELYRPIRQSNLNSQHQFVLPHEYSSEPYNSKDFLKNECELLIAEVSEPSIGLGIELGWANFLNIPILCIYREGAKISGSLQSVSKNFLTYSNNEQLIAKLETELSKGII